MSCPRCHADVRWATTPSGRAVGLVPTELPEGEAPLRMFWLRGTQAMPALPIEDRGLWAGGLYREHDCKEKD